MTAGPYEAPPPPGSFHGDYAYGPYGGDFHGTPGFPEYGYPSEAGWPSVEQGVCGEALRAPRGTPGAASRAWDGKEGGTESSPGWELAMAWPGHPCQARALCRRVPVLRGSACHAGLLVPLGLQFGSQAWELPGLSIVSTSVWL